MARLKVGISNLNTMQLLEKGYHVHQKLQENASTFTNPVILLTVFIQALEDLFDAQELARTDRDFITVREQKEAIVRTMMTQLGYYVADVSMGDPVKFIMGGYSQVAPYSPVGPLQPVEQFKVRFHQGFSTELFLSWRKRKGAGTYILEISTNPVTGFEQIACVQQCRFKVTSLTPGTTYFFRCIPVGALGEGGVSPVISCMAI